MYQMDKVKTDLDRAGGFELPLEPFIQYALLSATVAITMGNNRI